jgi:hypothetical protein
MLYLKMLDFGFIRNLINLVLNYSLNLILIYNSFLIVNLRYLYKIDVINFNFNLIILLTYLFLFKIIIFIMFIRVVGLKVKKE